MCLFAMKNDTAHWDIYIDIDIFIDINFMAKGLWTPPRFAQSATRTLLRSGTETGQGGLGHSLHSSSFQRCSVSGPGLCERPSTLSLTNHAFVDLALCTVWAP